MHVRVRAAAGAAAALLVAIAGGASAQAADLHCQASTAKIAGIGLTTPVEPLTAGSTGPCANASVAPTLPSNPAISANPFASTTYDAATKTGAATGGLLSLNVVTSPDALSQVPLEQAIATLGPVNGTLTLVTALPLIGSIIPVELDVSDALRAELMPEGSLISADVVTAHATVSCSGGSPALEGSSSLAGVKVLGRDVPVDDGVTQVVTLFGGQSITLSSLDPSKVTIVKAFDPITHLALPVSTVNTLATQLASGLATLSGTIPAGLPDLTLKVSLTPAGQDKSDTSLTQRGFSAQVDLSGVHVLDADIGVAKVSADAGACALPPKTTPVEEGGVDAITATGSVADQILACSDRRLVLMDVLRKGNMVKLLGAANRDYAGRRVAIRLRATNAIVGHATVQPDGSFQTTAPLPPRRFMRPARRDLVRYSAEIGHERSLPLKLERRMVVSSMSSAGGKVRITGRVIGPLTTPSTTIRLMRRLSCNKMALVKEFQPGPGGRFDVTVDAPEGQVAAVYRMTTFVRANRHNRKRFPTFTLPRGVALDTR